jgi:UDP-glucose 4-epimerase
VRYPATVERSAILVTGGAGYVGSVTVEHLVARGTPVVVLDDLSTGHRKAVPAGVPLVQGDVADIALVTEVVRGRDVGACVHFAARSLVGASVADPAQYWLHNVGGGLRFFEALRRAGVARVVLSSTAAVYGDQAAQPIPESAPTRPTNPYGWTKLALEQALFSYEAAYGFRAIALRYFNAAGATDARGEDHRPETHLIPLVLQTALGQRGPLSVFGADYDTPDGTAIRDYVHVSDLANAHLAALDRLADGAPSAALNLGSGAGASVRQVIETARRVTGVPIPTQMAARRPGDPARLVADTALAAATLGWTPSRSELDTIIESAWRWRRAHPEGYG